MWFPPRFSAARSAALNSTVQRHHTSLLWFWSADCWVGWVVTDFIPAATYTTMKNAGTLANFIMQHDPRGNNMPLWRAVLYMLSENACPDHHVSTSMLCWWCWTGIYQWTLDGFTHWTSTVCVSWSTTVSFFLGNSANEASWPETPTHWEWLLPLPLEEKTNINHQIISLLHMNLF